MESHIGNATIFDVAKLCGVSRGTVDRVLHGRGRVSEETVKKVRRAVEILGYKPNVNASLLATKRTFTFSILIPEFKEGEYWERIYQGFVKAASDHPAFSIDLDFQLYDQRDPESYKRRARAILEKKPSGVVMNTVFFNETKEFTSLLENEQIPYAFVDNKLDGINYTLHCGIDAYKSGEIGAFLLTNRLSPKEILLVRLIRDSEHKADPNGIRRQGFVDYLKKKHPECKIHILFIEPTNPQKTYIDLQKFFQGHPEVKNIGMINSRVHLLDDFLRNNPDKDRIVVGFDELRKNVESLSAGHVEYLVTRHIEMQSYLALVSLAEYVILKKEPAKRDNYLHMDILHRINFDDF